jgi:hypothetical protein
MKSPAGSAPLNKGGIKGGSLRFPALFPSFYWRYLINNVSPTGKEEALHDSLATIINALQAFI